MPCRLYLVNCLAIYSYLIPRFYPLQFARRRSGSGSTGFRRGYREALVQSQVRFNEGSGERSGEGVGGFGAEPG